MEKALLSNLKYKEGSKKKRKRIGRGQGSGHGGTATRGHKGQGSRSGVSYRPWFEGGQMPLVRRVPKFGFNNIFKTEYQVVNVNRLENLANSGKFPDGIVNPEILYQIGAVSKKSVPVKILGNGELKTKLEVTAHAFSNSAIQKIEAVGGKTKIIS
ncbi:MAG: LSU ribosomal protein L15p (L27Ae) [Ignavibacteriae bacterium]|nr:MAG: LSU ribosomal protein L15p (L27Ae) [Ignavibacteriota bacterium]